MIRLLPFLVGPETAMLLCTLGVYAICSRLPAGEPDAMRILERMVWLLPPLAVVLVFLTVLVPGNANWLWLARATLVSLVGPSIFVWRIVEGFGSGAKGQDAAFIIAFAFAAITASVGVSVAGAAILGQRTPAFAEWFRMRPLVGSLLVLASTVPIGIALVVGGSTIGGFLLGIYFAIRR
jgi:hypothetical protein